MSCKTLDKNERVLLGICSLAGSYRWQSPAVIKTVFSQSQNSNDFRGSELEAIASALPLARVFMCHVGCVSTIVPGSMATLWSSSAHLAFGGLWVAFRTAAFGWQGLILCHVLAAFTCCVASLGRPAQTVLLKSTKGHTGITEMNRHLSFYMVNQWVIFWFECCI